MLRAIPVEKSSFKIKQLDDAGERITLPPKSDEISAEIRNDSVGSKILSSTRLILKQVLKKELATKKTVVETSSKSTPLPIMKYKIP